jgi:hypothetical protein
MGMYTIWNGQYSQWKSLWRKSFKGVMGFGMMDGLIIDGLIIDGLIIDG